MDRQLFLCPAGVHYDYDEYVELTSDTPKLVDIFEDNRLYAIDAYRRQSRAKCVKRGRRL